MSSCDPDLWLAHIVVPFVPTLGPIHPTSLSTALANVLQAPHDGSYLPYDKEKRWGGQKKERLLACHIYQDEAATIIPTYQNGGRGLITLYAYAQKPVIKIIRNIVQNIEKEYPDSTYRLIRFHKQKPTSSQASTLFLASAALIQHATASFEVHHFNTLPLRTAQTLQYLATADSDNSGFLFLWERVLGKHDDGDIFVTLQDQTITGAVGPLKPMRDAAGLLTRYPVYFGVLLQSRRCGQGSTLWQTALNWASSQGLDYILLQAKTAAPAELFYEQKGLSVLGFITREEINTSNP